jgi:hypothetical protein
MFGVCSSSANTYVLGALVACDIKSDAARGEVADFVRARKGSRALSAFVCSMIDYAISSDLRGGNNSRASFK